MTRWDLGSLARAAESRVCGGALPESVTAVGTDSRSLPPAALFVALRGEKFDGHAFVRDVAQKGATAVVVDEAGDPGEIGVPRLVVKDTLFALGEMAKAARASEKKPVAAVTGSSGKTTTKEMLAAILNERGPVHATRGNLNNLIGVPLTVFSWPANTWAAVLEMGMNVPGEIARLTEIGAPDVGIITMVASAHLEGLGSIEKVAHAKGEMYAGLAPTAVGVVNADDAVLVREALPLLGKKPRLLFGKGPKNDVQVLAAEPRDGGLFVRLRVIDGELETTIPLIGPHNAHNAAAACAAAHVLGISRDEMARGLTKVAVPGGRLRLLRNLPGGVSVIDDTYNANPASMRAAFAALASQATGRKVAVLGSMFELGPTAEELHHGVGAAAADAGIEWVLTLGEFGPDMAEGAQSRGVFAQAFVSVEELCQALGAGARQGDWVLVKGSRGMKMERVVSHLEGPKQGPKEGPQVGPKEGTQA